MSAGDVTLTETERAELRSILSEADSGGMPMFKRIAAVEDLFAARTPTATGDDLRNRVEAALDAHRFQMTHVGGTTTGPGLEDRIRAALAASSAPVVSRPEAVVKAEARQEAASTLDSLADQLVLGDAGVGTALTAAIVARCRDAVLAMDSEAGGE